MCLLLAYETVRNAIKYNEINIIQDYAAVVRKQYTHINVHSVAKISYNFRKARKNMKKNVIHVVWSERSLHW